ncbi:TrbL/VirB6 plasmid conjugal transfer protein [Sinosporangium album]|uniref:TrbL/VirB6 plasmid conjugal transfer protein n=1 Tax=Sinosporangium album TaxID=504805 RepID=A0A1G7Y0Y0_9ACTN|nr:type IV secretion system protein [Sinosporangium album]SDG90061.1 TrbL/VirB6 plasmid conjugal transfer protein [Sinosporangium album]
MTVPPEGRRRKRGRLRRRIALVLVAFIGVLTLPLVFGSAPAAAGPCDLSADLAPEVVGNSMDGLLRPPTAEDAAVVKPPSNSATGTIGGEAIPDPATNYERYGTSGQFWHTYQLGCSDIAAVIGNSWANAVFTAAKSIDRLTITTYQAAATEGPLQSLKDMVDDVITNLASAMYWPYLRPIVIVGAIWLAWYGLIRRRATTTTEGVIWMVIAVTVAVWFFSRPGDFTSMGKVVTEKTGEVINSAMSGLPGAGGASCLPLKGGKEPDQGLGKTGVSAVDQNADALWSTLVCKPWLAGQFGTADPNAKAVQTYGPLLLDIQAVDRQEQSKQSPNSTAHQLRYQEDVASKLEGTPTFFIFQGKDWTSRLGIAIGALMAAMVAGLLIFLVAVSLLVLKVGFLLLLVLGPVFLLIGVHPGTGRIIAMRWVEMLIGTLLRQAVLALVLSVLVYGYALVMSTGLSWGMQLLFMALMTIAVFFYRRPFQHLFARMDGHSITTRMLGEAATAPMLSRAAAVLPPVAGYRVGRWGMRKAEPLLQSAAMAGGAGTAAAAAVAQGRVRGEDGAQGVSPSGARVPVGVQPAPLDTDGQNGGGVRRKAAARGAAVQRAGAAPPLNLSGGPRRPGVGGPAVGGPGGSGGPGGPSGPVTVGPSGSSSGDSGGSRGGWFGGRSGGGWAPVGGSSGGSSRSPRASSGGGGGGGGGGLFGGSRGSASGGASVPRARSERSGGGLFGGGSSGSSGSSRSSGSSGSSRGSRASSGGGGLFGGSSSERRTPSGSSGSSGSNGSGGSGGSRRAEAPPLWLSGRDGSSSSGGGGREEPSVPFWLRPSNTDRD